MKYTVVALLLFVLTVGGASPVQAQDGEERNVASGKAFALSLLLPGLGHRYVHGGDWGGWATAFALTDAALWTGLVGSEWRRNHLQTNYETLAATGAGADIDGKERDFFLNVASYRSSEEFLQAQLRNRNWTNLDAITDPGNQWKWDSEDDYLRFREMREDAESLQRRRSFIITTLVANRLIAGVAALRGARRVGATAPSFSLSVPPRGSDVPMMHLRIRW